MVADDTLQTLPLEIYRAMAGYRFSFASAVGVMLLILTVVVFIFIEEWTHKDPYIFQGQKLTPLTEAPSSDGLWKEPLLDLDDVVVSIPTVNETLKLLR